MAGPELFVITEFDSIIILRTVADSDTTILIWQNYSDLFIPKKNHQDLSQFIGSTPNQFQKVRKMLIAHLDNKLLLPLVSLAKFLSFLLFYK